MSTVSPSPTGTAFTPASTPTAHDEVTKKLATKPVILGMAGFGRSRSPAIFARELALHLGAPLRVVSVVEPVMLYAGTTGFAPVPLVVEGTTGELQQTSVNRTLRSIWPANTEYGLDVRFGPITFSLATAARDLDATMVIVGAAPHRRRGKIVSGVVAAQLVRQTRCPVLAVAPGFDHLPQSIIVATDFSAPSIRAAREAARLVAPDGTIMLATVVHETPLDVLMPATQVPPLDVAEQLLSRLAKRMRKWVPDSVRIAEYVLRGPADDEILSLAEQHPVDLIAIGTHGAGFVERAFVGSVATNVLHAASCSVLVAPPPGTEERAALDLESWGTAEVTATDAWKGTLQAFTERNRGRIVRLEVDDMSIGAQTQARGYVLHGVAYDPADRQVEIMLAPRATGTAHLTRLIGGVRSVSVTQASSSPLPEERDSALQIRADDGDTLLVFEG